MHDFHKVLFNFSENLSNTEISKIEIEDGKVIFTSRSTDFHPGQARFYLDVLDKRIVPLEAFNFNVYEQDDAEMLYKLVEDKDVIFDIGANIGWYSIHLSKKLPSSVIYAFEPISETFEQLIRNVELNQATNIDLNKIALSDKMQTLTFFYTPTGTGASSSVNITGGGDVLKMECQTNTIDQFIKNRNIPKLDFIKCDVEGAKFLVFKGGVETISKHLPIIFAEMLRKWSENFCYHPNDIIHFFLKLGYQCYTSSVGKLNVVDKVTEKTVEANFFFLHSIKHADKIASLT
jgi:FkbM family methyltransferase